MRKSWTHGVQAQQLTTYGTGAKGYEGFMSDTKPCHKNREPVDPYFASKVTHVSSGNDINFLCGQPISGQHIEAENGGRVSCNKCQRDLPANKKGLVNSYSNMLAVE